LKQERVYRSYCKHLKVIHQANCSSKEVKAVEFGAKVNMIQLTGSTLSSILVLMLSMRNKACKSIRYGRAYLQDYHISADDIYATNANRKYSTAAHIVTTSSVREGLET